MANDINDWTDLGTGDEETEDWSDLGSGAVSLDQVKPTAYERRSLVTPPGGLGMYPSGMEAGTEFTEAMSEGGSPVAFAKNLIRLPVEAAFTAAAAPGALAYGAAADVMSKLTGQKEYGGNIEAMMEAGGEQLPVQKFIASAAPGNRPLAVAANVAASLPSLASMMVVNPSGAAGRLLALGFAADTIYKSQPLFEEYAKEWYKPPEQQDKGKMAELEAGLIETLGIATMAGTHGLTRPVERAIYGKGRVLGRELSEQLNRASLESAPVLPPMGYVMPSPRGEPVPTAAETSMLMDQALREAQGGIVRPGELPAIDRLKRQFPDQVTLVPPTALAERVAGGGQAPYGKVSYMRGAEAPTAERTQRALVAETAADVERAAKTEPTTEVDKALKETEPSGEATADTETVPVSKSIPAEHQAFHDRVGQIIAEELGPDHGFTLIYDPELRLKDPDKPNDPGTLIGGLWQGSKTFINTAAFKNTGTSIKRLRGTIREEYAHALINTDEGLVLLSDFTGRYKPPESFRDQLRREGYTEDYLRNDQAVADEFIAKQAREKTPIWTKMVDEVWGWIVQKTPGLKLTRAQAARAILRTLEQRKAKATGGRGIRLSLEEDPYRVDEKLIMKSPYTGDSIEVNYRGKPKDGQAVVWTGRTQMQIPEEWLSRPAGSPQTIARSMGIRFDHEINGRWQFTSFDNQGRQSSSFLVKAGATPEEIRARYEKLRSDYAGGEDQPRPLPLAAERMALEPGKEFVPDKDQQYPEDQWRLTGKERPVTIERTDGTRYRAMVDDRFWPEDSTPPGLPSIMVHRSMEYEGKPSWSSGFLRKGEKIIEDTAEAASVTRYALTPEYQKKLEEDIKAGAPAAKHYQRAVDIQEQIEKSKLFWKLNPDKSWLENNKEYWKSVDPDAICQRSEGTDAAVNYLKQSLGKKYDSDMAWEVIARAQERGLKTPCPQCYVYSARAKPGSVMQKKYVVGVGGYSGELARTQDANLEQLARTGLRHYSSTDFKAEHIPGLITEVVDAEAQGIPLQAYSKQGDLARIFAPAGMYINLSIGRNELIGMNMREAVELRRRYPTVGTIYVAFNDAEVIQALRNPNVDHVIPWHGSGQAMAELQAKLGDPTIKDYTAYRYKGTRGWYQRDTVNGQIAPKQVTDAEHKGDLRTYLQILKERGSLMRFPDIYDALRRSGELNLYMKLIGLEYGKYGEKYPYQPPVADRINYAAIQPAIRGRLKTLLTTPKEFIDIAKGIAKEVRDGTYERGSKTPEVVEGPMKQQASPSKQRMSLEGEKPEERKKLIADINQRLSKAEEDPTIGYPDMRPDPFSGKTFKEGESAFYSVKDDKGELASFTAKIGDSESVLKDLARKAIREKIEGIKRVWGDEAEAAPAAMTPKQKKWQAIIDANPVLKSPDFRDRAKRWNELRKMATEEGMSNRDAVQFISFGMDDNLQVRNRFALEEERPRKRAIDFKALKAFLDKEVVTDEGSYRLENIYKSNVGETPPKNSADLVGFFMEHYKNYPEDIVEDFPESFKKLMAIDDNRPGKKKGRITWIEEDGGLWMVYDGDKKLGAIYDRGAKGAGEKPDGYDILDDWYNVEPGELLGKAKTFQEAVSKLRKIAKAREEYKQTFTEGQKITAKAKEISKEPVKGYDIDFKLLTDFLYSELAQRPDEIGEIFRKRLGREMPKDRYTAISKLMKNYYENPSHLLEDYPKAYKVSVDLTGKQRAEHFKRQESIAEYEQFVKTEIEPKMKEAADHFITRPWHVTYGIRLPEGDVQFYVASPEIAKKKLAGVKEGEEISTLGDLLGEAMESVKPGNKFSASLPKAKPSFFTPPDYEVDAPRQINAKNPGFVTVPYGYSFDMADLFYHIRGSLQRGEDALIIIPEENLPKPVLDKMDKNYNHPQYGHDERLDRDNERLVANNIKNADVNKVGRYENDFAMVITFDRALEGEGPKSTAEMKFMSPDDVLDLYNQGKITKPRMEELLRNTRFSLVTEKEAKKNEKLVKLSKDVSRVKAQLDFFDKEIGDALTTGGRFLEKEDRPEVAKGAPAEKGTVTNKAINQYFVDKLVTIRREMQRLKVQTDVMTDPATAQYFDVLQKRFELAFRQIQELRRASHEALYFWNEIRGEYQEIARMAGAMPDAHFRKPILDQLVKDMRDKRWMSAGKDFVDYLRVNLFTPFSFTLDFTTNLMAVAGHTPAWLAMDLSHLLTGKPVTRTFTALRALRQSSRNLIPFTERFWLHPDVEIGLGTTAGGEFQGLPTEVMVDFSEILKNSPEAAKKLKNIDYVLGGPVRLKRSVDNFFGRFGAAADLYNSAYRAGKGKGLRGDQLKVFVEEFVKNPPEDAIKSAIKVGGEFKYNRELPVFAERFANNVITKLAIEAYPRWALQFTKWAGEMIGLDPSFAKKAATGKATAEEVAAYLSKAATGWGAIYAFNQLFYNHVDPNTMEYVNEKGERIRLSGRQPFPELFTITALLRGDLENAKAGFVHTSIPFAGMTGGQGGLLSPIMQAMVESWRGNYTAEQLARELTKTLNNAIPGKSMLGLIRSLYDPTIREGFGAPIPGVAQLLPQRVNVTTGEPMAPKQRIPGTGIEMPTVGGTPFPGAVRVMNPVERVLLNHGFGNVRPRRTSLLEIPVEEVPASIRQEYEQRVGMNVRSIIGEALRTPEWQELRGEENFDVRRELLGGWMNLARSMAKAELAEKYGTGTMGQKPVPMALKRLPQFVRQLPTPTE